jgi:hypothetical protein
MRCGHILSYQEYVQSRLKTKVENHPSIEYLCRIINLHILKELKDIFLLILLKFRLIALGGLVFFLFSAFHPFYLSVTELNFDKNEKNIQISCKIFTDDFEKTLRTQYKTEIDLIHPKDKTLAEKQVSEYIQKHLSLKVNARNLPYHFIGFEIEQEAVWCYFETEKTVAPIKLEVSNAILYESLPDQTNIVHATVNGVRKSAKVGFPDKIMNFEFN